MTVPGIIFCADDFTGASDTLATLARAGRSARLFLSVSEAETASKLGNLDAVGLASSLRSMERSKGHKAMEGIAEGLALLGAPMAHFKICSTFDSSPQIGNICDAADAFARAIGAEWTAIIGGQPSLRRYCLFGNLFATAGNGEVFRIDRHPTMKQHPITPMTEADLRLHLRLQGWDNVGLIDFRQYRDDTPALVERLQARIDGGERHTLFDVSSDDDIAVIGRLLRAIGKSRKILCVGASSVAEALCGGRPTAPPVQPDTATLPRFAGPVFAFAGSRAVVTSAQVKNALLYRKMTVAPDRFVSGNAGRSALTNACREHLADGEHVLVQVSDEREGGVLGGELAAATAQFIKDVVTVVRPGCLAIAGGDTSSAAVQALGIDSISIIVDFDRGVPLVRAYSGNALDSLPMILKGGQMGSADMFDKLARMCAPAVPRRNV